MPILQKYGWWFVAALLLSQALILYFFGQPLVAASGDIRLWVGEALGPDNSQHLSDWYTLSHIIHGILFYWALSYFFPNLPVGVRLLIAAGIEVGWELFENTPWLIEHYRQQALAQGYTGDSIINSVSDTVAMVAGFFAARRLPVWGSVALVVALEAVALYFIRDSLALNIINLVYPLEFIYTWQSGG